MVVYLQKLSQIHHHGDQDVVQVGTIQGCQEIVQEFGGTVQGDPYDPLSHLTDEMSRQNSYKTANSNSTRKKKSKIVLFVWIRWSTHKLWGCPATRSIFSTLSAWKSGSFANRNAPCVELMSAQTIKESKVSRGSWPGNKMSLNKNSELDPS